MGRRSCLQPVALGGWRPGRPETMPPALPCRAHDEAQPAPSGPSGADAVGARLCGSAAVKKAGKGRMRLKLDAGLDADPVDDSFHLLVRRVIG